MSTLLVLISTAKKPFPVHALPFKNKNDFFSEYTTSFQIIYSFKILFYNPQPTFPSKSIRSFPICIQLFLPNPPVPSPSASNCCVPALEHATARFTTQTNTLRVYIFKLVLWKRKKHVLQWSRERDGGLIPRTLLSKKFDSKLIILIKLVKCAHQYKWCARFEIPEDFFFF